MFGRKPPEEICDAIMNRIPPATNLGPDQYVWDSNANGSFSVRSAYEEPK